MNGALRAAAPLAALAILAAVIAVSHRRERQAELSPRPDVENLGPRGIAALHAWLAESGYDPQRLESSGERPPPGATVVLAAPAAELDAAAAAELVGHAGRGNLVVWAVGRAGSQPELERRLAVSRREESAGEASAGQVELPLAPHPLVAGLTLHSAGGSVDSGAPGALVVAGHRDLDDGRLRAAAVSVPAGRGEVLLLAGPSLLENFRIGEADNLSLWARVAARGPVAFDERFREPRGASAPPSARALAAVVLQALAAALCLFWARARRLGAVRPPPPQAGRTTADYLASLAALYRRARAEPELCRVAWRRFRQELARRGIGLGLADGEVARRLESASPGAASAFRRAAALAASREPGPGELLALTRAVAEAEAELRGRR